MVTKVCKDQIKLLCIFRQFCRFNFWRIADLSGRIPGPVESKTRVR